MKNAITNSVLDTCRIDPNVLTKLICMMHPKMYDSYLAPNESSLRKQLLIVDKKEQMLSIYDFETRELLGTKSIAIGK
jgi:hypothetical protein